MNTKIEFFFPDWVRAGPNRSFSLVAKKLDVSTAEVAQHATDFYWRERLSLILNGKKTS